jgi:iron complex outermembrane receptor protein
MNSTGPVGVSPATRFVSALLGVLALSVSTSAFAQSDSTVAKPADQPASEPSEPKSEITKLNPYVIHENNVVGWNSQMTFSGRHTAGELLELPISISIITADFIKDIGATNLLGVLEYAGSGVTNRVAYREDFTVRGFRQAPLRDGTPYPNYGFVAMYDIEKIEVIKGPTALMFNSYGNISGGVNFVTKDPTAVPKGDAQVTVGNFDTYIASATVRGPLTHDGSVRYRFTAGKQLNGGWQGKGTNSNNYNNNDLYSASVDWYATTKLLLRFTGGEQHERGRSYGSGLIDPVTGKVAEISKNGFSLGTEWAFFDLDTQRASIEGILELTPDLTLRARATSYRTFWNYNQPTAQGAANLILHPDESPNYLQVYNVYAEKFPYTNLNVNSYVDATWIKHLSFAKNQLSAGFNYFENHSNYDLYDSPLAPFVVNGPVNSRPGNPNTLLPSGTGPQTQAAKSVVRNGGWSAYAQDTLSLLNEKLILAGGFLWVTKGTNSQAKSAMVPNYGAVYRFTKDFSAYASYGKSFVPRTGVDSFGTPLVNQKGTSKEVGLKFNAFNEHLFGTIAYFDIFNDNVLLQVLGTNQAGQSVFGNKQVGNQTNKGFESDIGWIQAVGPGDWSTYVTAYSSDPKSEKGLQPSRAVKTKYTVFTKYRFTAGAVKGLAGGFGYSEVGSSPGVGFATMPAYHLCSAFLGYSVGQYQVVLNVENLENKRGVMTGAEGPGLLALAPPLTWKVTTSRTW